MASPDASTPLLYFPDLQSHTLINFCPFQVIQYQALCYSSSKQTMITLQSVTG